MSQSKNVVSPSKKLSWAEVVAGIEQMPKETVEGVMDSLSGKFLNAEPVINAIMFGLTASKETPIGHVIAYGRGGFGKSEIASAILDQLNAEYKVIDMHSGYTTDQMLGGVNFAVWREGRLYYNLDVSMFSHEILILDEALSAPQEVLTMMRSTLTSGWYRQNDQEFKIKTRFIVICSNNDPAIYMGSPDMEAFLQRFMFKQSVDWSHISDEQVRTNFSIIIKRNAGEAQISDSDLRTLSFALWESDATPRIAVQLGIALRTQSKIKGKVNIAEIIKMFGLQCADMDTIVRNESNARLRKQIADVDKVIMDVTRQIVEKGDKVSIELVRSSYKLLNITRQQLDKIIAAENEIVPGIGDAYQGKIAELASIGAELMNLAARIVINE